MNIAAALVAIKGWFGGRGERVEGTHGLKGFTTRNPIHTVDLKEIKRFKPTLGSKQFTPTTIPQHRPITPIGGDGIMGGTGQLSLGGMKRRRIL